MYSLPIVKLKFLHTYNARDVNVIEWQHGQDASTLCDRWISNIPATAGHHFDHAQKQQRPSRAYSVFPLQRMHCHAMHGVDRACLGRVLRSHEFMLQPDPALSFPTCELDVIHAKASIPEYSKLSARIANELERRALMFYI